MEQREEVTLLQPVKNCCRRLRQEWEAMMHDADMASTQMLSSLKAQEAALMMERAHVQSLKQENDNLKRFLPQQTQEQEKRASTERLMANQIIRTIHKQLAEVKNMQCHLATQLAEISTSMENLRKSKREEDMVASPSAASELPCLEIVLPLEDEGALVLASSDKFYLEADISLSSLHQTKDSSPKHRQCFEQSYAKIKGELLCNEICIQGIEDVECRVKPSSSLQTGDSGPLVHSKCQAGHVSVKEEPDEKSGALQKLPSNGKAMVAAIAFEGDLNDLDKILLSKRLDLLVKQIRYGQFSREDHVVISSKGDGEPSKKKKRPGSERNFMGKRPRDVPIEVALQEDAPGLLERLMERGLMEDIVIYGAFGEDDWGNGKDQFKDLECIAGKLWGNPSGLFKQPQAIRPHTGGLAKLPVYCLSCLISLIDQAKSIRQRSWPVEWGWCRELQAFIFVFDKHNRIVLERPEYGNATYFFELVEFLPVRWQVARLIRVLSATALGKTALLENRPLEVGYELTADESKLLEHYGWAPSTGLGSFLNFCDRVYHDAYQEGKEDDNLEWRQKIGKCLMDGYDRGRIITPTLPPRFLQTSANSKLEDIKPEITLLM